MTRWRWISLGIVLFAVVYALGHGDFSEWSYRALRRREAADRVHLASLKHVVDSLRAYRDSLENDPDVQERVGREQFGMVRPGELLFSIERADTAGRDSVRFQ